MINLYEKNENNFNHNAYVLSEITKAETEEEINNGFNSNITYPLHDSKELSSMLVPGNIIKLPSWDKRGAQLFAIRRCKPSLDNCSVEVNLQHILTYKLDNNVVLDTYIQGKTRKEAVAQILANAFHKHNFKIGNNDKNTSINNLRIVKYSVLDALIGSNDNTVVNRYGGELIYNNFIIEFIDSIGEDKGIDITYAKNITGANMTLEDTDLITEIIPLGKDGLMLPEKSVKANNFDENNQYTRIIEFSNIGVVEAETDDDGNITNVDEIVTQEQAYELLRQACRDKFNKEHVNEVSFNLDLNLVELADCINFEGNNYSNIDSKLAIGDTVNVNIKPFNLIQKGRVYKLKRNVLTGELLNVEIGYKVKTLTDTINKTDKKIEETKTEIKKTNEKVKEETEKRKKLQVTMEARDSEIELSVKNEEEAREAAINILEDAIRSTVKEGDIGTLIEQNYKHVLVAIQDGSNTYIEIDTNGLLINDGKLRIKDSNDDNVVYMSNDCLYINDMWIYDVDKGSNFNNSFTNADEYEFSGDIKIHGDFFVSGEKDCLIQTKNYGERRIHAYETCEYYFGDLGFGKISIEGQCIIEIDSIFKEFINTAIEYHVFVQAYNGSIIRIEKYEEYFIVFGKEGTEFSWELKAKRLNYENRRLELLDDSKKYINKVDKNVAKLITNNSEVDLFSNEVELKENNDFMEEISI